MVLRGYFFYKSYRHILCLSLLEVKQRKLHLICSIQSSSCSFNSGRWERVCQKEGGLFASFVDISITFTIMSDKHRSTCTH